MTTRIRGSDVFVKEDLKAFLMALQMTAARYPQSEFSDGFLAAITSFRAMLGIAVTLDDIDAELAQVRPGSPRRELLR